ncbi:MAG TPA: acylphosphatase, partial [Candidatus Marinimicrobia bacterium]|nr:acylphosphatase [Candidatus Neomarinimicrobiota bacterium]
MNNQNKCVTFRVIGKVQGVWFRAYARDNALSLNIEGWVKNDPDGSVFGEALGSET